MSWPVSHVICGFLLGVLLSFCDFEWIIYYALVLQPRGVQHPHEFRIPSPLLIAVLRLSNAHSRRPGGDSQFRLSFRLPLELVYVQRLIPNLLKGARVTQCGFLAELQTSCSGQ